MRFNVLPLALGLACIRIPSEVPAGRIPPTRGETFAGTTVSLPDVLHDGAGVLVIGFSQASREAVTQWGTWLARDASMSKVPYYEMPVLAGVPKVLRGFVAGRINAAVADPAKSHFLPLFDHETEWKTVAGYTAPDDAYVLVVDGSGAVRWRTHGPPTGGSQATLKEQLAASSPK